MPPAAVAQPAGRDAAVRREFATPGGDLAATLTRIAGQAGLNLIVSTELVVGRRAAPLAGRMTLDEALTRVLRPAGLTYRRVSSNVLVVIAAPEPIATQIDREPAPAPSFPPSADIDTVVVVGHRVQTDMAVEHLLNDDLRRLEVTDSSGVAPSVASLSASPTGPGLVRLSLRGIYGAGDATVPVTFGETPIAGPTGTSADPGLFDAELELADVSRVEVFKGPQGTDSGVGSIAGRVAIRPAAPQIGERTLAISTAITALQGGGVGGLANLVANVPVDPATALRLVAYARDIPGFVNDPRIGLRNANHQDLGGVRVSLRRRLGDRVDATVSVLWQSTRAADGADWSPGLGRYQSDRLVRSPASKTIGLGQANLTLDLGRQDLALDLGAYSLHVDRVFDDTSVVAASGADSAACARFIHPGGGIGCDAGQRADFQDYVANHTPAKLHHQGEVTAFVQQAVIRRPLNEGGELRYGGYLELRSENYSSEVRALDSVAAPVLGSRRLRSTYRQAAGFAEAAAWAGPVRFTSGIRLADVQRVSESAVLTPNSLSGLVNPVPRTAAHDTGISFRERMTFEFVGGQVDLQVARGWRPGGVNTVPVDGAQPNAFRRDVVTTYEAAFERSFVDGRMHLAMDVFLTRWRGMQYRQLAPNGAFAYVLNAGDVRVSGLETRFSIVPAAGWAFRAEGVISDTSLGGDIATDLRLDGAAPGDRLPDIPRAKGFAGLVWTRTLPRGWSLESVLQVSARSAIGSQFSASSPLYVRSHASATVDAGLSLKSRRWIATINIRNLTDATAVTRATLSRQTPEATFSAPPRGVTVSLRREF